MGFDISYHPIAKEQMNLWYFNRLPEIEQEDFSQLQKIGREAGIDEFYINRYIETMQISSTINPKESFERRHVYPLAVVQGFFQPYFYTRGTALSFLLEDKPELRKYITSWNQIKPEEITCSVSDCLTENYSGGVFIDAQEVSILLAELKQEGETKDLFSHFFEENFKIFVKALQYAKEHNMGLLEASEVVEPNPVELNDTISYSNLYNCDQEGVFIYHTIAMAQIEEAIKSTKTKVKRPLKFSFKKIFRK